MAVALVAFGLVRCGGSASSSGSGGSKASDAGDEADGQDGHCCADAGLPDASPEGAAPDAASSCKDLDEQSCLAEAASTGKCSPLHGAKVPGGSKQFVACRSFCSGGAVMSCGLDPSGTCWLFPDTCVPEGWTPVYECNPDSAPACAGAFKDGGVW